VWPLLLVRGSEEAIGNQEADGPVWLWGGIAEVYAYARRASGQDPEVQGLLADRPEDEAEAGRHVRVRQGLEPNGQCPFEGGKERWQAGHVPGLLLGDNVIRALLDPSPDAIICKRLTDRFGRDGAKQALSAVCRTFTNVELAALAARWEAWARPKQMPPTDWRTWGNLTARGWGKTMTIANILTREIQAGRVKTLIMSAQNLTKTEAVQVEGLIAAAPPWFRPEYEATKFRLVWPNGARAFAYTPEVPDAIRSENADMAWLSEVQSWPAASREESYSNFVFATRVRGARLMWDATPKKGHPLLKRFLSRAEKHPEHHIVVRGAIYENPHIALDALDTMEIDYLGTQKGREELLGEMLGEEDSIFRSPWFDIAPRRMPDRLNRRILSVDPAITSDARSSDSTGVLEMGISEDRVVVIANMSGKHRAEDWAAMVIDAYVTRGCDLILVETNRGGDSHIGLLRVLAQNRGLTVHKLEKGETAVRRDKVVNVRPISARGQKSSRAEGAAALCERGRVSFVTGMLGDLEEQLAGFDGTANKSDDAVDAFVHGCHELAGLAYDKLDPAIGFKGIQALAAAVAKPSRGPARSIAQILGGDTGGRI
jgi:phage terminase large subunit-like protein